MGEERQVAELEVQGVPPLGEGEELLWHLSLLLPLEAQQTPLGVGQGWVDWVDGRNSGFHDGKSSGKGIVGCNPLLPAMMICNDTIADHGGVLFM